MPLETKLRKWTNQELNQQVNKPAVRRHPELPPQSRIAWEVLVGVFLIQLSVSSVLASQGIIISHLLHQSSTNNFGIAFLPPAVFSATWAFVEPWCRQVGVQHRGGDSRLLAGLGVLVLGMSLAASSLGNYPTVRVITFGIIGGAGCGMSASQCETQVALHSPPGRQGLGLGASMVAQALAQFIAPLFLVALLAGYGVSGASLIQAALVLHGLAGALLLRAVPRLRAALATVSSAAAGNMLQLHTYSSLPQDDIEDWRDGDAETELQQPEVEEPWDGRLRNHMGVEIMPQILEEEEDGENSFSASLRRSMRQSLRDSWCPVAPLEIYMPVQEDSTVKGNSPKPLLTPSSLSGVANDVFDFGRSRQCCVDCISWLGEWCSDFWSTLCKSLRELREVCRPTFFPALLMSSAVRLVPLCVASLVPSLAQHGLLLPRHEAAFALAVAGFGWLCAAVCTPCLLTPSAKRQMPLMYAIASGVSAIGLFLLSEPGSHDRLTLGCATVGLAHGILVLSCPHLLRRLCSEPELGNIQTCVSRTKALLDRGAALFMIVIALTFGLLAETVWSYGHLLFALAGLQACLGTAWLAWELGSRLNTCWTTTRNSNIMRAPTVEILNS